jgi:hypothetical protein
VFDGPKNKKLTMENPVTIVNLTKTNGPMKHINVDVPKNKLTMDENFKEEYEFPNKIQKDGQRLRN